MYFSPKAIKYYSNETFFLKKKKKPIILTDREKR